MIRKHFVIMTFAVVALAQGAAYAWNGAGHKIIALIAFEELSPQSQGKVVALIRKHPRFQEDFKKHMPEGLSAADRDRWLVMRAATWPDVPRGWITKSKKATTYAERKRFKRLTDKYHRALWHYINEPIYGLDEDEGDDEFVVEVTVNLDTDWPTEIATKKINVVQAIKKAVGELKSSEVSQARQALALCWLLHLVGDVHQPLHATALFTSGGFPKGDKGGNSIKIGKTFRRKGMPSLHSKWDGFLGSGKSMPGLKSQVKDILDEEYEAAHAAIASADKMKPEKWVEESYEAASDYVYTAAVLEAVDKWEEGSTNKYPHVALSQDYIDDAKGVAKTRAAEAGFRLARMLQAAGF